MKTKLTLFVAILASVLFLSGCASVEMPPFVNEGLVSYYPFNGNAKDESGNGNHGEVKGAALTEDRKGEQNKAYSFDGKDDFIEIPSSPSIKKMKAVSVSLWVKVNKNQKAGQHGYNTFVARWRGSDSDPQRHQSFWIGTHQNKFITTFAAPHAEPFPFRTEFEGNGWLHVAYAHDSKGAALFFNGEKAEPRKGYPIRLREFDEPLIIGAEKNAKSSYRQFLLGSIDDVRIYNRALSAEEVKALYDLEKPKGK
jgi:hypothetical protein